MENDMQAEFGIEREKQNVLFYKTYTDTKGRFQFHSQIEIMIVDEGELEVVINDKKRLLKAGEASVALSYDAHAYNTPNTSVSSMLIIPTYFCEEFISAMKNKRVTNPFICDPDTVQKINWFYSEIKTGALNEIVLKGYVYAILGIVMECLSFEDAQKSIDPDFSSSLLFYINENYKKDISLTGVAAHFGYSRSYVSRFFKSCFNIGFNQYITVIRLKNALSLLQEKKHSITYCALESGFNSVSTFYRVFQQEFGCSPKEYF